MNKNGEKDFKGWIALKEATHFGKKMRSFSEGDVWWCRIGENIGAEMLLSPKLKTLVSIDCITRWAKCLMLILN